MVENTCRQLTSAQDAPAAVRLQRGETQSADPAEPKAEKIQKI